MHVLFEDIRACHKKFSLTFWQTMTVMKRPLNTVIHEEQKVEVTDDMKVRKCTNLLRQGVASN